MFRGTGGFCQFAKDEDFPAILTSAVCRSSGGTWNGGHDLVKAYLKRLMCRVGIFFYLRMRRCFFGGNCYRTFQHQHFFQVQPQRYEPF